MLSESMIAIRNISKAFADKVLFRDASALVRSAERVGLVGANGSGKSTLLAMILGRVHPDRGEVEVGARLRIGHLPQEPESMPVERTVFELATELPPELAALHEELEQTAAALASAGGAPATDGAQGRLLERVGLLQSRFEHLGGYEIEHRAQEVLFGLGFQASDLGRRASELSGGWLMRIALARLLLVPRDILLLDEPTNHLDLESVLWLQRYLAGFAGTLILISHDREFLNALVGAVLHIDHGRLTRYTGNYDDFIRVSRARQAQLLAAKRNQEREIERQERFIERFRAKNTKASQVQSRIKALERMERIEIEAEERTLEFRFPRPSPSGQRVATLTGVAKRFGPKTVYDRLDLAIERGERIALVGPNGAGKSTLLKILAGVVSIDGGEYRPGYNVTIGYYTQYRHDMLDLKATVLENAQRCGRAYSETFLRTVLGRFLFPGDDVFKPAQVLSGGEKSRLGLVKILLNPPNFLLLDEPTIHLDIDSVEALIEALADYDGTLVTISHDVHFLRLLVNQVLRVEEGRIRAYPGGYSYYEEKRAGELGAQQAAPSAAGGKAPAAPARRHEPAAEPPLSGTPGRARTRADKRAAAEARNRAAVERRRVESRLARVEGRVEEMETHRAQLVAALEDPATYAHAADALRVNRELQQVQRDLDRYNAEWNELVEALRGLEDEGGRIGPVGSG